jgi:hypothetical protein
MRCDPDLETSRGKRDVSRSARRRVWPFKEGDTQLLDGCPNPGEMVPSDYILIVRVEAIGGFTKSPARRYASGRTPPSNNPFR